MTIDALKSIERGHVVAILNDWEDKFEIGTFYFHNIFFLIALLPAPIYLLVSSYPAYGMHPIIIIVGGTQIIFGVYLVQCLFNWRRLVRVEGIDINTNKELITQIVNGYYPKLEYEWDNDILIGSRPYSNFNFKGGLNVVIIFKDSDVYLNIVSIYKGGPNPWMALTNLGRAKEIVSLFKERMWHWQKDNAR